MADPTAPHRAAQFERVSVNKADLEAMASALRHYRRAHNTDPCEDLIGACRHVLNSVEEDEHV